MVTNMKEIEQGKGIKGLGVEAVRSSVGRGRAN